MPKLTGDTALVRHALELARQGVGLASPNPHVGAVVVNTHGEVVGEGFHTYDGVKHAEVIALEQAGGRAQGSTLYINLEPCSHHGRTGPCVDAVIAAGIKRVVASMKDPNLAVAGRGFRRLREAGIEVKAGLLRDEARRLNEAFAKYIRRRMPLVTLKSAMTLDGKIAPAPGSAPAGSGDSDRGTWITGEAARAHVQQLRHEHDAIMVGVGTVLADDPLLTDRSGLPRRRPLLRVVLDSRLQVPDDSRLVKSAQEDVLVFCSRPDAEGRAALEARGVKIEQVEGGADGRPDLLAVMRRLGELEITSVMVEGGSKVNGAMLASGMLDKVFFYYAPQIMGDERAVPLFSGPGFAGLGRSLCVQSFRFHHFGQDFAVEGYVRDPYTA
jgi:diaminohydroxyphosphoribosylaminopyrimidine deaminase/5-amino-6-(5-phosphoribosylamino)uracil reductase